jgi:hypothetical protein
MFWRTGRSVSPDACSLRWYKLVVCLPCPNLATASTQDLVRPPKPLTFPQSKKYPTETKSKAVRYTPWRRLGERRYSFYSFTISALDGGQWSASLPGRALPPGKGPPVPIRQEIGWAPEPVWTQTLEKNPLPLSGIESHSPGRPVRSQTLY